ncbi:MAG: methyltransferase domain-containing protein [Elusimicrobiota bacterium]
MNIKILFEIHKGLPQEGPGSDVSTKRALSMLPRPRKGLRVLDIGCGPGRQTIELARRIDGKITAVDAAKEARRQEGMDPGPRL